MNNLRVFDPTLCKKLVGLVGATPLPLRSKLLCLHLMSGVSPPTNFFEKKLDQKTLIRGVLLKKA